MPEDWLEWLKRGWHGVSAAKWMDTWLPQRMYSELQQLNALADDHHEFARVVRRERRSALELLIRNQYLLPWCDKKCTPFFRDASAKASARGSRRRADRSAARLADAAGRALPAGISGIAGASEETNLPQDASRTELDHPIPVSQLVSLVQMAFCKDNFDQAEKRLFFAWLCPPVLVTPKTHKFIGAGRARRCDDFKYPLCRYKTIELFKFDGNPVDPQTYTWSHLISDLAKVGVEAREQLGDIDVRLTGLDLPSAAEEGAWTKDYNRTPRRRRAPQERILKGTGG